MINQLNREDGQPTPYFVRGPVGNTPEGVDGYITAHLTLDYRYVCSAHCRGLPIAPWFRPAAAVAPMLELDPAQQLAHDVRTTKPGNSRANILTSLLASRVRCGTASTAIPSRDGAMDAPLPA